MYLSLSGRLCYCKGAGFWILNFLVFHFHVRRDRFITADPFWKNSRDDSNCHGWVPLLSVCESRCPPSANRWWLDTGLTSSTYSKPVWYVVSHSRLHHIVRTVQTSRRAAGIIQHKRNHRRRRELRIEVPSFNNGILIYRYFLIDYYLGELTEKRFTTIDERNSLLLKAKV